jgi:hypothetical protein
MAKPPKVKSDSLFWAIVGAVLGVLGATVVMAALSFISWSFDWGMVEIRMMILCGVFGGVFGAFFGRY